MTASTIPGNHEPGSKGAALPVEELIRAAHQIADHLQLRTSRSKVAKLCRKYRGPSTGFAGWFRAQCALDADERSAITYRDPTGERATRNADRHN